MCQSPPCLSLTAGPIQRFTETGEVAPENTQGNYTIFQGPDGRKYTKVYGEVGITAMAADLGLTPDGLLSANNLQLIPTEHGNRLCRFDDPAKAVPWIQGMEVRLPDTFCPEDLGFPVSHVTGEPENPVWEDIDVLEWARPDFYSDLFAPTPDQRLEELVSKDTLAPEEIAEARELIEANVTDLQKPWYYQQLQAKAVYINQRNSVATSGGSYVEDPAAGGICNLTSVAMALGSLGISNPDPTQRYDDALEYVRQDVGADARTLIWARAVVAAHMGAYNGAVAKDGTSTYVSPEDLLAVEKKFQDGNGDDRWATMKFGTISGFASQKEAKEFWIKKVQQEHLDKGRAVNLGIYNHITRLQQVTEEGLIADDPFGDSNLVGTGRKSFDQLNSNHERQGEDENEKTGFHAGNNTVWPWSTVYKYNFGCIHIMGV